MAAKKKVEKKDRHASNFMVRLPVEYRPPLEQLKKKTRRTITVEVQLALDKHLKDEGLTPPGTT